MKALILAAAISFGAQAEVISVNTPLKSESIFKIINESAGEFLAYEGTGVSGGLHDEIEEATITELTKVDGVVNKLVVKYQAFFMSVDWDFGDPVDEEFTKCTSELTKGRNGKYSVANTKTTCDFNPSRDIVDWWAEDQHPCCAGGIVVDSNMCFDSYEEGVEFCTGRDEW